MTWRVRRLWIGMAVLAGFAVLAVLAAILAVRSDWFREEVRARIVAEVQKASGGRAEIGSFQFDWKQMRAEVDGFVVHGTEPPDRPPLFRASSIVVGLKIVSVMKRSVDLQSLEVRRPEIYLMVAPDGRTNVPAPKVKSAGKSTVETILDLAIGRFRVEEGMVEVEGQGRTPFSVHGQHLRAEFNYDVAGPRYRGSLAVAPAVLGWGKFRPVPLDVNLALEIGKNRVAISSGRLATAQSQVEFSGAIESLADIAGSFDYKLRASLAEVDRTFDLRTRLEGPVTLAGRLRFRGTADYQANGTMRAAGVFFQPDPHFILRNASLEGAVEITPQRTAVNGLHLAGMAMAALTNFGRGLEPFPVSGRIRTVTLRRNTLYADGIHFDTLDGSYEGSAQFVELRNVHTAGQVTGFDVRKMMRVYNGQNVPWDAAASGPVELRVTLGNTSTLRLKAGMAIAPADGGAPVHGAISAAYDASSETLDLGDSWLALPSTRVNFSGVLGGQLRVHADSRNLDDVLPAFDVTSIPVKLQNGEAVFDGSVTGKLDDPHLAGRGRATGVVWSGHRFDALAGDVELDGAGIAVRNGSVRQGALELQGSGSLGMRDWKVEDASPLSASGVLKNAPARDVLALVSLKDVPLDATVSGDGQVSGTYADPRVTARFTATRGVLEGEPFDRASGSLTYSAPAVEMAGASIEAPGRRIAFEAAYRHQPGDFGQGRLSFHVDSNAMPLDRFQIVNKDYPGMSGTAELHGAGILEIAPGGSGTSAVRLMSLTGSLKGSGLRISDQPLQDVTLTAETKGSELVAHLDSALAGSAIHGEGRWNLAGDYPGTVQVSFKNLDLERLRLWLRGQRAPGGIQLTGAAEGTLAIRGPALDPDQWKGELRLPSLTIGPGGDLAAQGRSLALHNQEPIVIGMERNVVKVQSARLVGRATDLSLAGSINLQQKNPLDLRVNGKFDLATLQDFVHDIYGSGAIETGVTIRGTLSQPQIAGRLDIKDATINLADAPVGVSKTNGVIVFDGTRATIQSFSGESGGGTVTLSGFAGYGGDSLIFRLHATAHEMRLRYPEDFSTVANASLSLTGASDSSTLSGRITVLRTGFNPRSDFSSILAKSAEPVRTPSAQKGLIPNMHFDVQIDSSPDITFQSSLAHGLQAEASLRLRGTGSNPSLLGRINVTQGQIVFFGTPFTVNQGSIAFYNPVKIEPVLNLDLDTKARGVDVILNISGPINKLNLTPRSDPPMPFSDIVALLATGRSPTADYSTLMSSPAASPQSLQTMGASALLGQAIASPVTGRLQRFFGVTRLKIDPTLTSLSGVGNNPQARLTIEQQVTPELTFTYITDVTSTNPLVVQVEWAFSRQWSAVMLREENGLVGLNFVYKRRFK